MKFIIANITWNSNGWKGSSDDKSGHRWVSQGNIPHESWNFDFDNPRNTVKHIIGHAQFTHAPKVEDEKNLLIFYSSNKIVGFYGNCEVLNEPQVINNEQSYNLKASRDLSIALDNYIEGVKEKGFLEDKERIGMVGFNYLQNIENIKRIISTAIELNPSKEFALNNLLNWIEEESKSHNYWIFQGSPKIYDVVSSLKDGALKSWSVSAHKDKIKVGDKIILWVTGDEAGCYALCSVTSEVINREDDEIEQKYYTNLRKLEKTDRVRIDVEHNLWNRPVLKEQIEMLPEFNNFKVGSQGTNFSSTKEEYDTLLEIVENDESSKFSLDMLSKFRKEDLAEYLSFIKKLIVHFNLKKGDKRLVFTLRTRSLNLTIGQRYALNLYRKVNREKRFGVLSQHSLNSESLQFSGNMPRPYYTILNSLHFNDNELQNIYSGIKYELERSDVSGFSRHNNRALEDFIFQDFAENITNMDNPLNQILFGPPGTGKTYHTVTEAIKIVDKDFYDANANDRVALQEHFNNLLIRDWIKTDGQISFCTFHQSFSYEDFVEGIKPLKPEKDDTFIKYKIIDGIFKKLCRLAVNEGNKSQQNGKQKNFVLIIDEINRGNVSSIFGELITLIEPTKRTGKPEALEVVLPYSKEKLSVPSNVYIIGTMNTADRSIESLDTALRRRFSFKCFEPKTELIATIGKSKGKVDGIDLVQMLNKINERIEKLIDKDHKIGHSYFLDVKSKDDLIGAFKDKVIPLLEEYFFGDYGKIGLVLGSSFIGKDESNNFKFANFPDYDTHIQQDLAQRSVYKIKSPNDWDFESIYQSKQKD